MFSNNDVYVLLIGNIKTPNISFKNMSIFIDRINSPEIRPSGFINCQSSIDRKHILFVQKSTLVFFAVDVSILNLWPINTDVEMMGIAPVNWYKTRLLLRFDTQVLFNNTHFYILSNICYLYPVWHITTSLICLIVEPSFGTGKLALLSLRPGIQ